MVEFVSCFTTKKQTRMYDENPTDQIITNVMQKMAEFALNVC